MSNIPKDFHDAINDAVADYFINGKFNEQLTKSVDGAINDVIHSMFRPYGHLSKQIEKALEEKLVLDFDQLELPKYNDMIISLIKKKTVGILKKQSQDVLLENLEKMFEPAPKSIHFDDLVRKYAEAHFEEGCHCEDDCIHYQTETSQYGGITVKLWHNERKVRATTYREEHERKPDVHLYLRNDAKDDEPERYYITIIHDVEDIKRSLGTSDYDFDAKLFLWYCAKTEIKGINKDDDIDDVLYASQMND